MKIGLFDSGIGGIKVLESLYCNFKGCDFVYVFDKSGMPYGNKNIKVIRQRVYNACDFLIGKKVDIIIIACNTASCAVLDECKQKYKVPIYGLIPPLKMLYKMSFKKIVVLTTELTGKLLLKKIEEDHLNDKIILAPQKNLATYIEKYATNKCAIKNYIEENLIKYKNKVDCVFLGCTHYYYIKNELYNTLKCEILDGRIELIDSIKYNNNKKTTKSHTEFYYL